MPRLSPWIFASLATSAVASEMQSIDGFLIDRFEVTVAEFQRFADATGFVSQAEQAGGGEVYEFGWQQKQGWVWSSPFGRPAHPNEPAVHVTFDEAEAYCQWRGARLPTDEEWMKAAYTEYRTTPPAPFEAGTTYPYPTGHSPLGANCLGDCGDLPRLGYASLLDRGLGPVTAGVSKPGVNGLYDMGANVWEWVQRGSGRIQGTRGGSWWYGAGRMHKDDTASKPRDTAVVYIGFRCAVDE